MGSGEDKLGETIEVSVELTDFTDDPRLMAHLNDCVVDPGPPMVARLTYRFQPKANLGRDPESLADYEYIIFGGDDPEMSIGASAAPDAAARRAGRAARCREGLCRAGATRRCGR